MQKDAKRSASAQSGPANQPPGSHRSAGRRNRLDKHTILRGRGAFTSVLTAGRSLTHPPIRLFIRTLPDSPSTVAVGFAVTRSVRSAVKRNKIRRLMREAYRLHQTEWTNKDQAGGIQAVWMYTENPQTNPQFNRIEKSIGTLIAEAVTPKT